MRKPVVLITGANGEIGHGLIDYFSHQASQDIVALDLRPLDEHLQGHCQASIVGDIVDQNLLQRLVGEFEIHAIYHLAALLSTRAEYTPDAAHAVNVNGTLNLLKLAHEQARWHGNTVKFLFPSSIAAYGLPDRATKMKAGKVSETEFAFPRTMYGCNKLYCEQLGRYFSDHFRQLAQDPAPSGVDFRSLRYPGLISAQTAPSGGTSDYAPEMLHAAARGEAYDCFVDPDAVIPFMAMPDAIDGLVQLAEADAGQLRQRVYNVTAFSPSAGQIREEVLRHFPDAQIGYEVDLPRTSIVDSWPAEVNDDPAREDWGWSPRYDFASAFRDYLVPGISRAAQHKK